MKYTNFIHKKTKKAALNKVVGVKWSEIRKKWLLKGLMVAMGTKLNIEISNWKRQQIKHHQVFIWDEIFFPSEIKHVFIAYTRLRRWTPWQVVKKERLLSKVLRWRSVGESQARIPCSTNNPKVRVVMKLNICAPLARSSGNRMFRYKVLSIPTQAVKVHKNFVHFNSLRVNNKHILSQRNDR